LQLIERQELDITEISLAKIADQYIVILDDTEDALELIDLIRDNIKQFEVVKGTMDDVFINVIGGERHV